MLPKSVQALLRKVFNTGFTIFKLRPNFFVKGLIYFVNTVADLIKE